MLKIADHADSLPPGQWLYSFKRVHDVINRVFLFASEITKYIHYRDGKVKGIKNK